MSGRMTVLLSVKEDTMGLFTVWTGPGCGTVLDMVTDIGLAIVPGNGLAITSGMALLLATVVVTG